MYIYKRIVLSQNTKWDVNGVHQIKNFMNKNIIIKKEGLLQSVVYQVLWRLNEHFLS